MKRESKLLSSRIQLAVTIGLAIFHFVASSSGREEQLLHPSIKRYSERFSSANHEGMTYPVTNRLNHSRHPLPGSTAENSSAVSGSSVKQSSTAQKPKRPSFDPLSFYSDQDIDGDFDPSFLSPDYGISDASPEQAIPDDSDVEPIVPSNPQRQSLPHSPVIYRYYGKSRSRTRASGSIPFILLGPNVEHWKRTGEHLAARGFSVIACERDPQEPKGGDDDDNNNNNRQEANANWAAEDWWNGSDSEGANLVLNVLQASRWSKAILVACDSEAVIAIQAAMKLAPDKIAGVVLCGDLREVDSLLSQTNPELMDENPFAIDSFLKHFLPCPFAIAWDGEGVDYSLPLAASLGYDASSPAECLHGNRCFILGGGIAPHRLQPETFSWTLTRFVEDKVAPFIPISERKKMFRRVKKERSETVQLPLHSMTGGLFHKLLCGDYFSTGSFVVYGRVIATVIFYATILKVGMYQYGNFVEGMVNMKSRFDMLKELPRKFVKLVSGFFLNYGYAFHLFRRRKKDPFSSDDFEADLLTQDKLDQDQFGIEDDAQQGEIEESGAEEEEEREEDGDLDEPAEGRTDGATGDDEIDNDEDSGTSPAEEPLPEKQERRRFEPPPFFLLDRVIASADSTVLYPKELQDFRA